MKIIRDKKSGDYYTSDKLYQIEKGVTGWNVNKYDNRGFYKYDFSANTLKEVKDSLTTTEREVNNEIHLHRNIICR